MERKINNFLIALVLFEAVIFLVPTTLLYLFGQLCIICLIFLNEIKIFNFDTLSLHSSVMIELILLILGYALFSLWWLVFRFRFIEFKDVRKYIWFGIALGTLAAITFIVAMGFKEIKNLAILFVIFGGPLVLLITLFFIIGFWGKHHFYPEINQWVPRYLPWH